MRQGIWRNSPALIVAAIALFVALGGSVYAAKKARINGKAIKAKSIPGNRVKPRSLPPNRLRPALLRQIRVAARAGRQTGGSVAPLTGTDINELTLGEVPSAAHAESSDTAQSAVDAQTALNAVNAIDAQTVNGHSAGCMPGTQLYAGACWQSSAHGPVTAPVAAKDCAAQGGALPEALQLAAFAAEPGVNLEEGNEWSSDLTTFSGPDAYAAVTVSSLGVLDVALGSQTRAYRCVIPLVT